MEAKFIIINRAINIIQNLQKQCFQKILFINGVGFMQEKTKAMFVQH